MSEQRLIEVSIVIPCLNEADTLAVCIRKALEGIRQANIAGEVIVATTAARTDRRPLRRKKVPGSCQSLPKDMAMR